MKIKAQQMTFRQDITKYKIYWLMFRCIVHNICMPDIIYLMNLLSNLHMYYIRYKNKYLTKTKDKTHITNHKLVDTLERKSTNGPL